MVPASSLREELHSLDEHEVATLNSIHLGPSGCSIIPGSLPDCILWGYPGTYPSMTQGCTKK